MIVVSMHVSLLMCMAHVYSVILCYACVVGFIPCISAHAQLIDGVSLVLGLK